MAGGADGVREWRKNAGGIYCFLASLSECASLVSGVLLWVLKCFGWFGESRDWDAMEVGVMCLLQGLYVLVLESCWQNGTYKSLLVEDRCGDSH